MLYPVALLLGSLVDAVRQIESAQPAAA